MKERLGLPEEGHGYTAKTLHINITPSVPQRDLGFVVVVCLFIRHWGKGNNQTPQGLMAVN